MGEGPRLVSFCVPAWNEAGLIGATVDAIHESARAAGIDYEIVVADDSSDDGTGEFAEAHGARVVRCGCRQIAGSRNAAARASSGDMLIFVDADTIVSASAVRGVVEAVRGGARYGGATIVLENVPRWIGVVMRWSMWLYRRLGIASGAYLFCTREAYDDVGGFDEAVYAAEEGLFGRALRKGGGYAWVNEPVVTSGRKLRTYSAWELWRTLIAMGIRGKRGLRSRERLGVWYEPRREDPGAMGSRRRRG